MINRVLLWSSSSSPPPPAPLPHNFLPQEPPPPSAVVVFLHRMGGAQSANPPPTTNDSGAKQQRQESNDDAPLLQTNKYIDPARRRNASSKQLTGFELVQFKCRRRKRSYDKCYGDLHQSFTTGKSGRDDQDQCEDLFQDWQRCILVGMQKDRDRRGLGKAKEGSAIAEFEAEMEEE